MGPVNSLPLYSTESRRWSTLCLLYLEERAGLVPILAMRRSQVERTYSIDFKPWLQKSLTLLTAVSLCMTQ